VSGALLGVGLAGLLAIVVLLVALTRRRHDPAVERRLDGVERCVERLERSMQDELRHGRRETAEGLQRLTESLVQSQAVLGQAQAQHLEGFERQLATLRAGLDRRVEALRDAVDERLRAIQQDNAARLEQMRQTVDEKLHATLDARLGESFRQVSERLELVYLGLGEMQALAAGVGDLKRVLTNVKVRGTWGEIHLGRLLEQVLAPEQYDANVATVEGSGERVEFAVRLPGRGAAGQDATWLPLDSKFPLEDYHALVEAADRGDAAAVDEAGRRLEARVKGCARDISAKYLNPPRTTDFAIMFLPNEGLYAEVLRRPGLTDVVQREHRIVLAGPTTLWAILTSLQMGFRTLAIERRSSEVWALLGAVKTEFGRFGTVLDAIQKNLHRAVARIDDARKGTRAIERRLSDVEELPAGEATALLEGALPEIGPGEAWPVA
jgi:DNA recombination protein RmuC